jgi:hypothetical protein
VATKTRASNTYDRAKMATPTSTGSGVLTCLQHVSGTRVAIASCSDAAYNVNEAGGHPIKSPAPPSLHRHRQSYSVNLQPAVFRGAPSPLIFASRRPRNICLQTTIFTHANDEMPFLQCDYYCMTNELLNHWQMHSLGSFRDTRHSKSLSEINF